MALLEKFGVSRFINKCVIQNVCRRGLHGTVQTVCIQKKLYGLFCHSYYRDCKPTSSEHMRKKHAWTTKVPKGALEDLNEDDLEEDIRSGWGKGGQSVNKTENCVILKHKPTGLFVKCHATRSLDRNKQVAREMLKVKLDNHFNGDQSVMALIEKKKHEKKMQRKQRAREKMERLKALNSEETDALE